MILTAFLQSIIIIVTSVPAQAGTLDGADFAAPGSVAIGADARADGDSSVAVGTNSFALFEFSTSLGSTSNANSLQSTAIGASALADQPQATVLGSFAQVFGEQSTGVGAGSFIEAREATVVGGNATALADQGVALGSQSFVDDAANGAVALGSSSLATEVNTVSVGNADTGLTRRIVNVAPALYETDAVNLYQFNQGLAGVREDAFAGIAAAAAFNPVMPSRPGKTAVSLGAAGYRGEQAVSVSVGHRLSGSNNTLVTGGVSFDSGQHALGRVGVSWEF